MVEYDKPKLQPFKKEQQNGQADALNYCRPMFPEKTLAIRHEANVEIAAVLWFHDRNRS